MSRFIVATAMILLMAMVMYPSVSGLGVNIPKPESSIISGGNYSINVNNSLYWQGHTGTDGSWLTGIVDTNAIYNHTGANLTSVTTSFLEDTFSGLITTATQNWIGTRNIRPRSNASYDIGSPAIQYRNIYLSGNLSDGTNNLTISNILTGTTANNSYLKLNQTTPQTIINSPIFQDGIKDNASTPLLSVDPNNRQLLTYSVASGSYEILDWGKTNAVYGTGGVIFSYYGIMDGNRFSSIDPNGRLLYAGGGISVSYDWGNNLIKDSSDSDAPSLTSIDPNKRILYASDGMTPMIEWSNIYGTGVDFPQGIGSDDYITINPNSKILYSGGKTRYNWQNNWIYDNAGTPALSIDLGARTLYNSYGINTLDWTGARSNDALMSFDTSLVYLKNGIGDINNAGFYTVDTLNRYLVDPNNDPSLKWSVANPSTAGAPWGVAIKSTIVNYADSQPSIDPNNRILYASDGTTPVLNWANGNITTYNINPSVTNTYSLGSSTLKWLKGWFSGLDVQGSTLLNGTTTQRGNFNQTSGNATINNFYGGMWMHNDTGLSGTFNSTYQRLYFSNAEYLNGFTFHSNSALQLKDGAGLYQAIYKLEGEGANNHEYHSFVYINEVQQNNTIGHAIGQPSNSVQMHGLGMIRIAHNDNVTVRLADLTASGTGTQIDANINLVRIGN